jgi:hypothetical protein
MKKVKILGIEPVTHDVKRFIIEKPEGFIFTPGQATEVAINIPGWTSKKRPFTFTSLNSDHHLEFIIKGYPLSKYPDHRGVTEQLHKLNTGDELLLGDPWGTIQYKGVGVFIAGGAGITPFIAIFRHLASENKLSGNKLIFSNKTVRDVILEHELKKLFKENNSLILTLTQEEKENYEQGRISKSLLEKYINDFSTNFYLCGPKGMVKSLTDVLKTLKAKTESIIFEE